MAGVQLVVDEDKRHRIRRVRGVRTAARRVDEHLGVAVVGGDEERSAALLDGLIDAAELRVDRLDGANGGFELAGVTDHVGVGEVDDDDVEGGVVDGFDHSVGDA